MKKALLTIAMIISTVVAFAQNAVDGNWKGSRETPNGVMEVNYSFKVEGNKLTGIWKNQRGESTIEEGTIDGKKISFTISFGERKINYTGELVSENELVIKNERGETKLTRVK